MKQKIYCFNNGGSRDWLRAMAIGDDGHVLAQHICSHECYMRHDLGMEDSKWKHENYNKHFGDGNWELEWVENPKTHTGLQEALKLNKALAIEAAGRAAAEGSADENRGTKKGEAPND